MPVNNRTVLTAIGKKLTNVRKQTYINVEIDGHNFFHDFHLNNGLIIDYWQREIRIKDNKIPKSLVFFERKCSEKLLLLKNDDNTHIYIVQTKELKDRETGSVEKENIENNSKSNTDVVEIDIQVNIETENFDNNFINNVSTEILEDEKSISSEN